MPASASGDFYGHSEKDTDSQTNLHDRNIQNATLPNDHNTKKLIGYRNQWYDITNFIRRHPGGDVIEKFVGKDATSVIQTFHKNNVMKHWKPYAEFNSDFDKFEIEMQELETYLTENGYYGTSVAWYLKKCFYILVLFTIILYASVTGFTSLNYGTMFASGISLALLWQQSGMIMHDSMHLQITNTKKWDERIGLLYGSILFGISARWWKDEHIYHHALTNTVDGDQVIDPQADEVAWAQNHILFPIRRKSKTSTILCKIQSWTFFPFCVLFGRVAITIDSMREEKRLDVWLCWLLHITWLSIYLYFLSSWQERLMVYVMGCMGEGVLHIQLLINHYSKTFYNFKERQPQHHFRYMIECNLNIKNPPGYDWFHGGLNFHHEHHCFPRLPQNRLREVSAMIRERCHRHGVKYDEMGFFPAIANLGKQLSKMQVDFMKIDIRN